MLGVHWLLSFVIAVAPSTILWLLLQTQWTFKDRETNNVSVASGTVIRLTYVGANTALYALFYEVFALHFITLFVKGKGA